MTLQQEWEKTPLGRVANIVMGQSPASKFYSAEEVGLPFLQGCAEFGNRFPRHRIFCSQGGKLASAGTILFSVRAPVGKLNIADQDYIIGRGLASISGTVVATRYLEHFLQFEEGRFRVASQGSTFEAINSTELAKWSVVHPKNEHEQIKIADVLSTVDQAIEQTDALTAKHQRIKTGLMQDLLTRGIDKDGNLRSEDTHEFKDSPLGRIPVDWEVAAIEQKLERIIDYRGRTPAKVESGVPLLTAKNVRDGYINEEPREFIAESAFNSWMTRGIPKPGDVLFTTEAPMGNVALVPEYRIALAQRLITLCPKPNELSQAYLFWLLHWKRSTERLELLTSGSTVVGVKQSVFRKVEFSFPGLAEQQRISVILNSLNRAAENQSNKLTKLRSLKTALMQDLLTGDVSVTPLMAKEEIGV